MNIYLKLFNALDSLADHLNEETAPAFCDICEALEALTGDKPFFKDYAFAYSLIKGAENENK